MRNLHLGKLTKGKRFTLELDEMAVAITIVAVRGAGKTNTATVIVEEYMAAGVQIVVLDPVGVWWGLRSSGNGKAAGLPIVILGGEHGDAPLEPTAGKVVADLAAHERLPFVLDLSEFESEAAKRRFVEDFADRLYRAKAKEQYKTPVLFVLEEAEEFAPQKPQPGEQRMLGSIERIVKRGRNRGIVPLAITQRVASLNKNVTTQSEMIIAMRLTSPQDRKAIKDWIDAHATDAQRQEFNTSVASLQRGEAYFWSPVIDLFKRVQVRKRTTFDSSATPKAGERRAEPKTVADVDLDALRRQMAETIERAEANDPQRLQAEIRTLKQQLVTAKAETPTEPETVIERVEVEVWSDEDRKLVASLRDVLSGMSTTVSAQTIALDAAVHQVVRLEGMQEVEAPGPPQRKPFPSPQRVEIAPVENVPAGSNGHDGVSRYQQGLLESLAQFPAGLTRAQLAVRSNRSVRSSAFSGAVATMKKGGLIDERDGDLFLTSAGEGIAGPPPPVLTGDALLMDWVRRLKPTEADILQTIVRAGRPVTREDVSIASGRSLTSSSFTGAFPFLRKMGLIEGEYEFQPTEALR